MLTWCSVELREYRVSTAYVVDEKSHARNTKLRRELLDILLLRLGFAAFAEFLGRVVS
jgi:hypothetical protein